MIPLPAALEVESYTVQALQCHDFQLTKEDYKLGAILEK